MFAHEGGIASPFIAHWPKGLRNKGALNSDQPFHLIDVLPTFCELAGAKYPDERQGRRIPPAPGISLLPHLIDPGRKAVARTLFWQHESCAAVRRGNWKLVTGDDRDGHSWELNDLSADRSETENLADRYPAVVEDLRKRWTDWAKEVHVLPFPKDRKTPNGVPK